MNNSRQVPPSVADLQVYLIQLQEVLRRRQEAAAAADIAKMQLQSLEAQAQRVAEMDRARLKAEADHAMAQEAQAQRAAELDRARMKVEADHAIAQEAMRAKIETERLRQQGEIQKARLAAEAEASRRQTVLDSTRISAEALKSTRIEAIREHSKRQTEGETAARKLELAAARDELRSYLQIYKEQFDQFQSLKAEVSNYLKVQEDEQVLLKGLRVVREGVRLFPRFADLIGVLRQAGIPDTDAVALVNPNAFSSLRNDLDGFTRNVEAIPAVGLEDWQPIDNAGISLPPWEDPRVVPLWKERGKASIWAVYPELCVFGRQSLHGSTCEILDRFNSNSMGARSNWALPTIEELRRFSQSRSLSLLGADRISRAWATYASAPGRVSSYCFIDGKRETTGENDKCSLLLVSN